MTCEQIRKVLRAERRKRLLSPYKVAEMANGRMEEGITLQPKNIYDFEKGVVPSLAKIILWADTLGMEVVVRKRDINICIESDLNRIGRIAKQEGKT